MPREYEMRVAGHLLDEGLFDRAVETFLAKVEDREPDSGHFESFRTGAIARDDAEGYKMVIWRQARDIIESAEWTEDDIGSGRILETVISAIEIENNNLLQWYPRNGPGSAEHGFLHDAQRDMSARESIEGLLFRHFSGDEEPSSFFDEMVPAFRKSYATLGYLWFLKDPEKYMPLRTRGFEQAFKAFGIDVKLQRRISWENYSHFLHILQDLRAPIAEALNLDEVRLIDAHSFAWVVGNWPDSDVSLSSPSDIAELLVRRIMRTVASSNGQTVERRVKEKVTDMSPEEFKVHVEELISQANGRCAVTGLLFEPPGQVNDPDMALSVDRIHSDRGYNRGNLQLVCWFVNRWKSADDPDNFLRLMQVVRRLPGR